MTAWKDVNVRKALPPSISVGDNEFESRQIIVKHYNENKGGREDYDICTLAIFVDELNEEKEYCFFDNQGEQIFNVFEWAQIPE